MKINNALWRSAFVFALFFIVLSGKAQPLKFYDAAVPNGFYATMTLNGYYYSIGYGAGGGQLTKITANTAGTWNWTKAYQMPANKGIYFTDIKESHSGHLILTGLVYSNQVPEEEIVVMEVNQLTGAILQSRIINLPGEPILFYSSKPRITRLNSDPDCPTCAGGYMISSGLPGACDDNVLLTKLDYGLNPIWMKQYDANCGEEEAMAVMASTNPNNLGGVVVIGKLAANGAPSGTGSGFLLEVDGCDGSVLYNYCFASMYAGWTEYVFNNAIRDFNGNILVCGTSFQPYLTGNGAYVGVLVRLQGGATPGNYAPMWGRFHSSWSFALNAYDDVIFTDVAQLQKTNGDCITGYYRTLEGQPPLLFKEPRLLKFKITGAPLLQRDMEGPYVHTNLPLTTNGSSKFVVSLPFSGSAYLGVFPTTFIIAACPKPIYQFQLSTNTPTQTTCSFTPTDVVSTQSTYCSVVDVVLTTTDACSVSKPEGQGTENPTDRKSGERGPDAPQKIEFEILPNPAAESVQIRFDPNFKPVHEIELQVLDVNGKILKTEMLRPSTEAFDLDISDLPKGIYLIKIDDSAIQKLTKM